MKKHIYYILAIIFLSTAVMSCSGEKGETPTEPNFLKKTTEGIYAANSDILVFNKLTHQIAINPTDKTFRIQTDMQDQYVHCAMSATPSVGASITITVDSNGLSGLSETSFSVKVEKIENDKAWLWDKNKSTGFIVRTNP